MEGKLLVDYSNLLFNSTMRDLMKTVNLSDVSDCTELDKYIGPFTSEELIATRIAMKKFVDEYFFAPHEYHNKLWYDKLQSFAKFVVIGLRLERANLRKMGGDTSQLDNIPVSYANFAALVNTKSEQIDEIKKECEQHHLDNCAAAGKYANIYTN